MSPFARGLASAPTLSGAALSVSVLAVRLFGHAVLGSSQYGPVGGLGVGVIAAAAVLGFVGREAVRRLPRAAALSVLVPLSVLLGLHEASLLVAAPVLLASALAYAVASRVRVGQART